MERHDSPPLSTQDDWRHQRIPDESLSQFAEDATEKQCRDFTRKVGAERLIQLTCNPALPNFTLTKFLWVRENEPDNWRRVRSVMLPKDYVRFRLTGRRAIDVIAPVRSRTRLAFAIRHDKKSAEIRNDSIDLVCFPFPPVCNCRIKRIGSLQSAELHRS